MTSLCILGATGSVGGAALAVAQQGGFVVECLTADNNVRRMQQLCLKHRPRRAIMRDVAAAEELHALISAEGILIEGGDESLRLAAAGDCCTVIAAIAGAGGLPPVLEAARCGRRILLANKESLVIAGNLLMRLARQNNSLILPIDSEHAALFDLLSRYSGDSVRRSKLWLTASGGALRDMPLSQLAMATPQQVLAHPTWTMGKKITVDSATMMNKVLEVMEAAVLFEQPVDNIGVIIHPQSIVHALLEEIDGTLTAQMAMPDMQKPIARMLSFPKINAVSGAKPPDWQTLSNLTFKEPDPARYPVLPLAAAALTLGGTAPAALSAANETAVARFLDGAIKFTDIARINTRALEKYEPRAVETLDDCWAADKYAREWAAAL